MSSDTTPPREKEETTVEQRVYRMVGAYVFGKLRSKYQLSWDQVKDRPDLKGQFEEAKEKVAREAFLAVRSRTGADFVEYFTATLCSVPQRMPEDDYLSLTKALVADPDRIRSLTLLALSARA